MTFSFLYFPILLFEASELGESSFHDSSDIAETTRSRRILDLAGTATSFDLSRDLLSHGRTSGLMDFFKNTSSTMPKTVTDRNVVRFFFKANGDSHISLVQY
jgi:hypothetical protein